MFCYNCGYQLSDGDIFCNNCGQKVIYQGMGQGPQSGPGVEEINSHMPVAGNTNRGKKSVVKSIFKTILAIGILLLFIWLLCII